MKLDVARGTGARNKRCTPDTIDLIDFLQNPIITDVEKSRLPWVIFGNVDKTRADDNVLTLNILTLDIDDNDYTEQNIVDAIEKFGYDAYYYSTYSSWFGDEPKAKWRVLFKLKTSWQMTDGVERWNAFYDAVREQFPLATDPSTKNPARIWFVPAVRQGQPYVSNHIDGTLLDIDWFMTDIGKLADSHTNGNGAANGQHKSVDDQYEDLIEGRHFHEYLRTISMRNADYERLTFEDNLIQCRMLMEKSKAKDPNHPEHSHWKETLDDLERLVKGAHDRVSVKSNIPEVLQPDEWSFDDLIPLDILVDPILIRQCTTLLSGEGGTGKSSLALKLAIDIALGNDTMFGDEYLTPSRVSYYVLEDSIAQVSARIAAIVKTYPTQVNMDMLKANLLLHSIVGKQYNFRLVDEKHKVTHWKNTVIKTTLQNKSDAVFIDPMGYSHSANENDQAPMSNYMQALADIAVATNTAVLLIHHNRKPSQDSDDSTYRGSSAIRDNARAAFKMRYLSKHDKVDPPPDNAVVLEHDKHNHTKKYKNLYFTMEQIDITFRQTGTRPPNRNVGYLQLTTLEDLKEASTDVNELHKLWRDIASVLLDQKEPEAYMKLLQVARDLIKYYGYDSDYTSDKSLRQKLVKEIDGKIHIKDVKVQTEAGDGGGSDGPKEQKITLKFQYGSSDKPGAVKVEF